MDMFRSTLSLHYGQWDKTPMVQLEACFFFFVFFRPKENYLSPASDSVIIAFNFLVLPWLS